MTRASKSVEPSRAIKLCGTEEVDPPSRKLAAGAFTAELDNGQLRYIAFNGVEALRGIAFLIRDQNWGTYTPRIDSLSVREEAGGFAVEYTALCADAEQRLTYEARITGSSDGALAFEAVATPQTDFVTNRAGFVVLHPAGLAGERLRVTHVDGREEETRFPERISPSQPVFDIRALSHEAAPGLWATCRMEGDAFEMEDQRNWTDASYKTYVRPLALPWGYTLAKGSRHEQSVRLSFTGGGRAPGARKSAAAIELGRELALSMPEIGVALPGDEIDAAFAAVDALRALKPRFLVAHADLRENVALTGLERVRQAGEAVGAKIVLEVVVPDGADARASLETVAAAAKSARLEIDSIVASSASDLKSWQPGAKRPEAPTVEELAAAARAAFPGVSLGGGMLSFFTELNRKRPKAALFDFITHTTCSIVHAADDRSVMETLETLPAIIKSTRAMIGEKPYRLGPSAIAARMNPYGKGVLDNPANRRVCLTNRDPRQRGLFNAAWTLGYVAACAYGGVASVAMGALAGPLGFIHRRATELPQPYFDSLDGDPVYPAFHVTAGLARGAGQRLVEAQISEPGKAAALAWREGARTVIWLANLTAEPMTLRLSAMDDARAQASVLDASAFATAVGSLDALNSLRRPLEVSQLNLDAYAVARVEVDNDQAPRAATQGRRS
jgi:D-apionolactonase